MRMHCDIVCEAPISAELLYNFHEHLIPTLIQAIAINFKHPKIEGPISHDNLEGFDGIGTGMSGGVDSLHVTLRHMGQEPYMPKVTHLITVNSGALYAQPIGGGTVTKTEKQKEAVRTVFGKAREIANELSLPLVEMDSNIYEVCTSLANGKGLFVQLNTFLSIACVYALQKLFKTYLFSSSYKYTQFDIKNANLIDSSYYDLLNLNCFSTSDIRFYSEGAPWDRIEKLVSIVDSKVAQRHLHVCLVSGENCGQCMKCARTMLSLDHLGYLDEFSESFPIDKYKKNLHKLLTFITKSKIAGVGTDISIFEALAKGKYKKELAQIMNKLSNV